MRPRLAFGSCTLRSFAPHGAGLVLAFAASVWPATAAAYCRMTTAEPVEDPLVCITEGIPLAWGTGALTYSLDQELYDRLEEAELRNQISESFAQWERVQCADAPHNITLTLTDSLTDESSPDHRLDGTDVNAIVFHTAQQWRQLGYTPQAFALTEVWFDANSGQILGADMEINDGRGPYVRCPEDGCSPVSGNADLQNVVTHEAGHFLGLAHSNVRGSTMLFSAAEWETDKRTLEPDDEDGFCAAYAGVKFGGSRCSVSPGASSGASASAGALAPVWAALGLFVWARLRRRRD